MKLSKRQLAIMVYLVLLSATLISLCWHTVQNNQRQISAFYQLHIPTSQSISRLVQLYQRNAHYLDIYLQQIEYKPLDSDQLQFRIRADSQHIEHELAKLKILLQEQPLQQSRLQQTDFRLMAQLSASHDKFQSIAQSTLNEKDPHLLESSIQRELALLMLSLRDLEQNTQRHLQQIQLQSQQSQSDIHFMIALLLAGLLVSTIALVLYLLFSKNNFQATRFEQTDRLLESLGGMRYICDYDNSLQLQVVEGDAEAITGTSAEQLLASEISLEQLIHPDDRIAYDHAIISALEANINWKLEYRVLDINGNVIWVEDSGIAQLNEQGIQLIGSLVDVTERKANQVEMSKLAMIARHTKSAVIFTDADSRIEWVNQAFVDITEYSVQDSLGKKPGELLQGPESNPSVISMMSRKLRDGQGFTTQILNYAKSGRKYWLQIEVIPREHKGQLLGFMAIETDITAQKEIEEKYRVTEQKWLFAIENGGHGVWEWDIHSNHVEFSDIWLQMLGYHRSDVPSHFNTWQTFVHPDDLPGALAQLQAHLDGDTPSYRYEHRLKCSDGSFKWILARGTTLRKDKSGKPTRMLGTHTDIDDLRRTRQEISRKEKMLQQTSELANIGGWELDLENSYLYWSEQVYKIHEVDINNKPNVDEAIKFYAPDARPVIKAAVEKAIAEGTPWDLELPLITAKGNKVWVRALGQVEFKAKKPVRLFGAFQDISAQRAMRLALQTHGVTSDKLTAKQKPDLNQRGKLLLVGTRQASADINKLVQLQQHLMQKYQVEVIDQLDTTFEHWLRVQPDVILIRLQKEQDCAQLWAALRRIRIEEAEQHISTQILVIAQQTPSAALEIGVTVLADYLEAEQIEQHIDQQTLLQS